MTVIHCNGYQMTNTLEAQGNWRADQAASLTCNRDACGAALCLAQCVSWSAAASQSHLLPGRKQGKLQGCKTGSSWIVGLARLKNYPPCGPWMPFGASTVPRLTELSSRYPILHLWVMATQAASLCLSCTQVNPRQGTKEVPTGHIVGAR